MNDLPRWLRDTGFVPAADDGAWEPLLRRDLAVLDELVRSVAAALGELDDPWHDHPLPPVELSDAQRRLLDG